MCVTGGGMENVDKVANIRKYWKYNWNAISSMQRQISIPELTWVGISLCTIHFLTLAPMERIKKWKSYFPTFCIEKEVSYFKKTNLQNLCLYA